MDKLEKYQIIIERTLTKISQMLAQDPDIESLLCIDHQRKQYILMSDGWFKGNRHYHPVVHIQMQANAEVWLRADNTDLEVGKDLIKQGIDIKDMIAAFYSPNMRKYVRMQIEQDS
ncbi:MAG: hypothetical protein EAZ97_05360 [Bacteroidetes bacterium]|nr:MAG: hypothetical protein EAZ97_05360 [Bacteroidota bacterium]